MPVQELNSDTKILIIRINHSNAGFFAYLSFVLNQILYCEENGLLPVVYFGAWSVDGPNAYHDPKKGDNMWDYYFEPVAGYTYSDIQSLIADSDQPLTKKNFIQLSDDELSYLHGANPDSIYNYPYGYYTDLEENPKDWYDRQRQKAQRLIKKYIRVKKELLDEVDDFVAQHFNGHQVIAAHIRGTDKGSASDVEYISKIIYPKQYFPHIDAYVREHPGSKIFLATDQAQFVEEMQAQYPGRILTQSTIFSSSQVNSFQKEDRNNYQKGKEVLLDCLLLSRCHQMLKCASAVGEYALYFNADLRGIDLNELYGRPNIYQKVMKLLLIEPYTFLRDLMRIARSPEKSKSALFRHALIGYIPLRRLLDRLEATQFSGSKFWQPLFFFKKYIGLVLHKDKLPFQQAKQLISHGRKRKGAGYYSFRNAKGKKYFEIRTDGHPQATFLEQFLYVLTQIRFAEVHHLIPVVNLDHIYNYFYDMDFRANVWENYFEPILSLPSTELDKIDPKTITFLRPEEQGLFFPIEYDISAIDLGTQANNWLHHQRTMGARLTTKYVDVKPEILKEVDGFYETYLQGQIVLGVHLSEEDKHPRFEEGQVQFGSVFSPEQYFPFIDAFLSQNPNGKLFVTTDQSQFRTTLVNQYDDRVINPNTIRASTKKTTHSRSGKGYNQGIEVLTDTLLLSKCDFLIRNWSYVGEVATYFNPSIPVIDLFCPQSIDDFEHFFSKSKTAITQGFSGSTDPTE